MAVATLRSVAPLLERRDTKLGRAVAGRRDAHELLTAWAVAHRKMDRPLVWVHAPRGGEGMQARSVVRALRRLRPGMQVAYTYFSPSAETFARRFGADVTGYLPWDHEGVLDPVLDALSPDLIAFTKTEVWPVLAARARTRRLPVALFAASVAPSSGRLRWPARYALRDAWSGLSAALAASPDDAHGLERLGVPEGVITVTGDPAVDAAVDRLRHPPAERDRWTCLREVQGPVVVAGSTWPSDERLLLPAMTEVRRRFPGTRLVIAPHEPDQDRVGRLIGRLLELGWHPGSLAHVEIDGLANGTDAVVVERLGALAHLYTVADVAYVGGGFQSAGLHSVVEPAAARVGVVIGPRHGGSRSAAELVRRGGAVVARELQSLTDAVLLWVRDHEKRLSAAERAFGYIEEQRGAASRTARALVNLINRPHTP